MTTILYGRPPLVFDPPGTASQTSPLIPGSTPLEEIAPGSVDEAMIYAPPGVLERRYTLALALRALKPGGRLDTMALKDKGGSRLNKDLTAFGVEVGETAKAHHRRCVVIRPETMTGIEDAISAGGPRLVSWTPRSPKEEGGFWSQPGIFAWDRVDTGSQLLSDEVLLYQGVQRPIKGAGADLGCGVGVLGGTVLFDRYWPDVTSLRMIDLDRRALDAAKKNVTDPRATFEWADARTLEDSGDLDFVVMNPPFHDGGAEDRRLGQAFVLKAAGLLKKGGTLWLVANRHLPYEAELNAAFKRVTPVTEGGGYKLFEAVK